MCTIIPHNTHTHTHSFHPLSSSQKRKSLWRWWLRPWSPPMWRLRRLCPWLPFRKDILQMIMEKNRLVCLLPIFNPIKSSMHVKRECEWLVEWLHHGRNLVRPEIDVVSFDPEGLELIVPRLHHRPFLLPRPHHHRCRVDHSEPIAPLTIYIS